MNKNINFLIAVLLLTLTQTTFAQTPIGVRTAFQVSNSSISGVSDNIISAEYINTYSFGLVTQIELGSGFFFRPEINYSQKGAKLYVNQDIANLFDVDLSSIDDLGIGAKVGLESRFQYIDVPLNIGYTLDLGKVKALFYAGPTFSYATSGTYNPFIESFINVSLGESDFDLDSDYFNTFDIGANIGANLTIPIASGNVFFDVRYNHSISSLIDIPIFDLNARNNSIAFGIGYMYNI